MRIKLAWGVVVLSVLALACNLPVSLLPTSRPAATVSPTITVQRTVAVVGATNSPTARVLTAIITLTATSVPPTEVDQPTTNPTALSPDITQAYQNLQALQSAQLSVNNSHALAQQYGIIPAGEVPLPTAPAPYERGSQVTFWATNTDTNAQFEINATLRYRGEYVYFFVDNQLSPDPDAVQAVAAAFDSKIYPTTRAAFGSEANPGVDGDSRVFILYARGLGSGVAGYYSSADEFTRPANPYSNQKEMFYINADTTGLNRTLESTLAHEFQHMIHWALDPNEETWVNEGASELSAMLNEYGSSSFANSFLQMPDIQLNDWNGDNTYAHYGGAFLFLNYLHDRFGADFLRAFVNNPSNGLPSLSETLRTQGSTLIAEQVVGDWFVANLLNQPKLAAGAYGYPSLPNLSRTSAQSQPLPCSGSTTASVSQFGADYWQLQCAANQQARLQVQAEPLVTVLPTSTDQGRFLLWSNRHDNSVTAATHSFTLPASGATLSYRFWYELETDYDYAYLSISTDGGQQWQLLKTAHGTDQNPVGNNLGWGYNGISADNATQGAWQTETVDLSAYAGQTVLLRFQLVSDDALNWSGLALDEIAIPELAYYTDFEQDNGGWELQGFVRLDNTLPQEVRVQWVRTTPNQPEKTLVLPATVLQPGSETVTQTFTLDPSEQLWLVVSGQTQYTTQPASYTITVLPPE